jgi:hypothetical protein
MLCIDYYEARNEKIVRIVGTIAIRGWKYLDSKRSHWQRRKKSVGISCTRVWNSSE